MNSSWTIRLFAVVGAAVLCCAARSGAQSSAPPNDGKREFTISGCLLRSGYAGYQVDAARIEAIDGKPVPDSSAAATSSPSNDVPKKWILEGGGNLGAQTGKKVEVIGRSDWQPPASAAAAADEPPNRTPHIDVKSVKAVAPTCS